MLETAHRPVQTDLKTIETVVDAPTVMLNHMILPSGTGLPEHVSNANLCMILIRGQMTLRLGSEMPRTYQVGDVVEIPLGLQMNLNNFADDVLEFYVVKTPNPKII